MNEITGDKQFVLQLLKDTARNLTVRHPEVAATKGMKSAVKADSDQRQAERDQIVERLQRSYEAAQMVPAAPPAKKGAKAADAKVKPPAATTAPVVEEVWYAPRDRTIALLQSAMDEYIEQKGPQRKGVATKSLKGGAKKGAQEKVTKADAKALFYRPKPAGARPAGAKSWVGEQYDNLDPGWLEIGYEKLKYALKGKHPFIKHRQLTDFRYPLQGGGSKIRVALLADWGGGNQHATAVADQVRLLNPAADYCIHLGDVYYAGTEREVNNRFFGFWPGPPVAGRSFALNSNHEMYSAGYPYFNVTLPRLGQEASYFCLENDEWRLIGLDTGYVEHDLTVEQVEWLTALVNGAQKRNILLSHHQPFSAFDRGGGGEERLQKWTRDLAQAGKIDLWMWGHEHLCAVYKPFRGITGRCIGHGCFPYDRQKGSPHYTGPNYPKVQWVETGADPRRPKRGVHGFALLEFDGGGLTVSYIDEVGKTNYVEKL